MSGLTGEGGLGGWEGAHQLGWPMVLQLTEA